MIYIGLLSIISKYAPIGTIIAAACALLSLLGLKLDIINFYESLNIYWKFFLVLCVNNCIVFSVILLYLEKRLENLHDYKSMKDKISDM